MATDALKLPRFVKNWADLATRLGVSRRMVQEWRARFGADCPADKADGRKEVKLWEEFMVTHQLKRADEKVGSVAPSAPRISVTDFAEGEGLQPDGSVIIAGERFPAGSESDWKKKLLEQKVRQAESETRKKDGELLVASELEVALGQAMAGITTALNHFPSATARFLVGIRDVHVLQQKLESEVNALLQRLNACRYLEDCISETVRGFGADKESADLLAKVEFAGQDRDKLLDLVALLARRALSAVGARALQDVAIGANAGAGTMAHAATGQVSVEAEETQRVTRNTPARKKGKE